MSSPLGLVNALGKTLYQSSDVQNWNTATVDGAVTGTAAGDWLQDNSGATRLIGGAGDDTYSVSSTATLVVEQAGGGVDTVNSWLSTYTLPANVENLYVGTSNAWGVGNTLDNIITAGSGSQTLDGGAGDDILYGGAGSDIFISRKGEGSDVILDFQAGAGGDKLRLDGAGISDFTSLQSHLKQVGGNTVVDMGAGQTLTLNNVQASGLTADNFVAPVNLKGAHLTFSDDFNTFSMRDPTTGQGTWTTNYDLAGYNGLGSRTLPSNAEKQIYTDPLFTGTTNHSLGLNPFVDKNGVLEIHADKVSSNVSNEIWGYQYTSGNITTKDSFAQQYGYFEVRAQAPSGQGLWPCIWLLPAAGGWPPELDILESVGDASVAHETSHSNVGGFNTTDSTTSMVLPSTDGYHTYGLSWKADQIIWYIDGQEVKCMATPADMHQKMYLLINLAVGGSWPGDPDPSTDLHAQFNVDYVHIYSYDDSSGTSTTPVASVHAAATSIPVAAVDASPTTAPEATTAPVADASHATTTMVATTAATSTTADTSHTDVAATTTATDSHAATAVPATVASTTATVDPTASYDVRTGTAGADWMDGSGGHLKLIGGAGDDSYWVDSAQTAIVEQPGGGNDTVMSSVSWTLGPNLERLQLMGSANIDGHANDGGCTLIGNSGANHLYGGAGADYIDGGAGADIMEGGAGDDFYVVDDVNDVVIEQAGGGYDRINSSVTYHLSDNVEKLTLTGSAAINAYGNALANVIEGNSGANIIVGGAGDDYLTGGGGADAFVFAPGSGRDMVSDFSAQEGDVIDVSGYAGRAHTVSQVGADTVIDFGSGDAITLVGVKLSAPNFASHVHWS